MSNTRQAGLTLLEILVATALFSIVAGAGYSALDQGLRVRARLDAERSRWQALDGLMNLLERDLSAVVAVARRDAQSGGEPLFRGDPGGEGARRTEFLRFTRRVHPGLRQEAPASPLQRVAWRWDDGVLERASWPRLDQPRGAAADAWPLLQGVDEVRLRFLAADGNWSRRWGEPGSVSVQALPRAVEFSLWFDGRGPYKRVFLVGAPR
ncbi:MAG: type II secretion system minor pseudopilin GspJ [Gammaproteobacteria bacterium]|nr:type II secretion system minor pseudopilin GspJ [Gammaproteobacteria bacterium]